MPRFVCLLFTALLLLVPSSAFAQRIRTAEATDVWSEPAPGVRFLRRSTTAPAQLYVAAVDLGHDGVRVQATPHRERWSTVSERAASSGAEVVINGGFWATIQTPRGLAVGDGEAWPSTAADPDFGTFFVDTRGAAHLVAPDAPPELDDVREAVSGRPMLVLDGAIDEASLSAFPGASQRQPRTAVGLTADGRTLLLVVVDGRQNVSRGMDLYELATTLVELGADRAMNLDGGGSSEMFVRHAGGVVSVPSRGRWEVAVDELLGVGEETRRTAHGSEVFVRGRESEVINHLAVFTPAVDVPVAEREDAAGLGGIQPPPPPMPPRVRLGAWREPLAMVGAGAGAGGALLILGALAVRFRRRAAR